MESETTSTNLLVTTANRSVELMPIDVSSDADGDPKILNGEPEYSDDYGYMFGMLESGDLEAPDIAGEASATNSELGQNDAISYGQQMRSSFQRGKSMMRQPAAKASTDLTNSVTSTQPDSASAAPLVLPPKDTSCCTKHYRSVCTCLLQFFCNVDEVRITASEFIAPLVQTLDSALNFEFFMPYLPPLTRPGWLLYCIDALCSDTKTRDKMVSTILGDALAGVVVAIVLIPQSLGQASLANLPPVYGLKSSIFPAVVYFTFGTSMQLNVGPSSTISLLVASLINKYGVDFANHPNDAVDLAVQASMGAGIILVGMSILNLGYVMRFISVPVFTGYVTAVTFLIGLSQMKAAFGFTVSVPQVGADIDWYYQEMQWYADNWNGHYDDPVHGTHAYRNPYALQFFVGFFVPLFLISRLKGFISTKERKKLLWFKALVTCMNFAPLLGLILCAVACHSLKTGSSREDYYVTTLKVVGEVPAGVDLFRVPSFKYSWSTIFVDVLPLTMLSFYESFAISRKYATINNELSFLNPSQELWTMGVANIVGSVTSAYPVSGSFTRTAVSAEAGAKSPFAAMFCLLVIVFVQGVFLPYLHFIPYPALAALICASLYNNVGVQDGWEAWRSSNKDAFVFLAVFFITFTYDTYVGLVLGILLSAAVFLYEVIFDMLNSPEASFVGKESEGIRFVRLNSDLNFLTVARMRDSFINELLVFDNLNAIIVDFVDVKHMDLSSIKAFSDFSSLAKERKVRFIPVNVKPHVQARLCEFQVFSDDSSSKKKNRRKENIIQNIRRSLEKHKSMKTFLASSVDDRMHASFMQGGARTGVKYSPPSISARDALNRSFPSYDSKDIEGGGSSGKRDRAHSNLSAESTQSGHLNQGFVPFARLKSQLDAKPSLGNSSPRRDSPVDNHFKDV